jgi:curli biogenesis system outer membrane secretion channel CsgG
MKPYRIIAIMLCFFVYSHAPARAQDMDTELTKLTENLAGLIKDHGSKKVTVLDFTDLDGNTSEIGKYVAEQLTVDFVLKKRDFSVLDRANLKKIMDEHKLTASGLVDPENAKKLGMFAGVDAMIFGKTVPAGDKISVTATIVTTDTAEIIGGGKASFKNDSTVQELKTTAVANTKVVTGAESSGAGTEADLSEDKPKVVKSFGNLVVELQSLKIVNGGQYLLTMTLTNRSKTRSIWVAGSSRASLFDPNGNQFGRAAVSGISYASVHVQYTYGGAMQEYFNPAAEISPADSITATFAFVSSEGRSPSPGVCNLQLEFFLGDDFVSGSARRASIPNLVTKFEAK